MSYLWTPSRFSLTVPPSLHPVDFTPGPAFCVYLCQENKALKNEACAVVLTKMCTFQVSAKNGISEANTMIGR